MENMEVGVRQAEVQGQEAWGGTGGTSDGAGWISQDPEAPSAGCCEGAGFRSTAPGVPRCRAECCRAP